LAAFTKCLVASALELTPDRAIDLPLASAGTAVLDLAGCNARFLELQVREHGVDVTARLDVDGGKPIVSDDLGIPRHGVHRFAIADIPCQSLHLFLQHDAGTGSVNIRLARSVGGDPVSDERISLALQETRTTQIGADHGVQDAAAADQWAIVATAWSRLGEPQRAAEAWFHAAERHARSGHRLQAGPEFERALAAAGSARDNRLGTWARNDLAMNYWRIGEGRRAGPLLQQALAEAQGLDDELLTATVLNNSCLTHKLRGNIEQATACFSQALDLSRSLGDARRLGTALNNLGGVYWLGGNVAKADSYFRQALEQRRSSADRSGEADSLINLELIEQARGRLSVALQRARDALLIYRALNDPVGEGRALYTMGMLEQLQGRTDLARDDLKASANLRESAHARAGLIDSQTALGSLDNDLERLRQALTLAQADADPRQALDVTLTYARALREHGQLDQAAGQLKEARRLSIKLGDDLPAVHLEQEAARIDLQRGNYAAAATSLRVAEHRSRRSGYRLEHAETLALSADLQHASGRRAQALASYAMAAKEVEDMRTNVFDAEVRARFFALHQSVFRAWLDALLQDPPSSPMVDLQALLLADRSRARSLLDLLGQEKSAASAGELDANERLNALTLARAQLPAGDDASLRQELDRRIRAAERERNATEKSTAQMSRGAGVLSGIASLQKLLGDDSRILFYARGKERLHLWTITKDHLRHFDLGLYLPIDAMTRPALAALRDGSAAADTDELLERLADKLIPEAGSTLANRRIIVIPDGSLGLIPFAALRRPDDHERRLLETNEISVAPSLSAIVTLGGRSPRARNGAALVIADPVFDREDSRIPTNSGHPGVATTRAPENATFRRLPYSGQEAAAIQETVAATTLLSGYAANRAAVFDALAHPYAVIHFATHGILDTATPAASGLVLSQFGSDGAPLAGFLGLRDISALKLDVDLVVLSACDTELGAQIQGEGIWGLPQAFLVAGANQVVGSLWPVPDNATAKLMAAFYRALGEPGTNVTGALRKAQLSLLAMPRYRAPREWAGFQVYGNP
jgi:CHAT domain-containing protein/tetratricopeptide (TPR) repeat protein